MEQLTYTLISDGSSDRALISLINWAILKVNHKIILNPQWADLAKIGVATASLSHKIEQSIAFFPCDLLFIHRDAEKFPVEKRHEEIKDACSKLSGTSSIPPYVVVIPVRMLESWLLVEEKAIRVASGNPNGIVDLKIPTVKQLEKLPDPKKMLCDLLESASELSGRRLKKFNARKQIHRVASEIESFTRLERLASFQFFYKQLQEYFRDKSATP